MFGNFTCSIDGNPIRSGVNQYYVGLLDTTHNMLCEQGHLSHSPHTLKVNVTIGNPDTQMFWLDKIEYAPLLGVNLAQEIMKFDASDSSVQFDNSTGAWQERVSRLVNETGRTGATVSIKFNGTSISIYGFNEGNPTIEKSATVRYFIDNKGDTTFDLPASKKIAIPGNPSNDSDFYNQLFLTVSDLAPGPHEMTLTYTGVFSGIELQWLSIDYFYVNVSKVTESNSGKVPAGNGGGGGGGSGSGRSNGQPDSSNKFSTGAIAGVVGGIGGLALIGLIFFFLFRKRKTKAKHPGQYSRFQPQNMYNPPPPMIYSPFGPLEGELQHAGPSANASISPVTVSYEPPSVTPPHLTVSPYSDSNSSTSNPGRNFMEMKRAQMAAVVPESTLIERRHQDSGVRYPQPGQVVDIPPDYSAT